MSPYRQVAVRPGLSSCVSRVLVQDPSPFPGGNAPSTEYQVLPAPHSVIGFQFRGRIEVLRPSGPERLGRGGVTGVLTSHRSFRSEPGATTVLVVLRPCGAFRLLGCPMGELSDEHVALDALVPAAAARGAEERVVNAAGVEDAAAAVQSFLLTLLERTNASPHPAVIAAADLLLGDRRRPVESVARRVGISRRQLERLFTQQVGVAPKEFASIAQFHAALARLPARRSWADLALEAGYTDQAHFVRSFARRAGQTPGQFAKGFATTLAAETVREGAAPAEPR